MARLIHCVKMNTKCVFLLFILTLIVILFTRNGQDVIHKTFISIPENTLTLSSRENLKRFPYLKSNHIETSDKTLSKGATFYDHLKKHNGLINDTTSLVSNKLNEFKIDWCRVREARVDWKAILAPCKNKTIWDQRTFGQRSEIRTDATQSVISQWILGDTGEFSKFFIQSRTVRNKPKKTGGDSWRVRIKGQSSVPVTVLDLNNGMYEVLFLIYEAGEYEADIVLDYTMCDGLKDPPVYWFRSGNSQGKNQEDGILQGETPYLLQRFSKDTISFNIKPPANTEIKAHIMDYLHSGFDTGDKKTTRRCGIPCKSLLWDGFGRWTNKEWQPYIKDEAPKLGQRKQEGTLMIFGDSVANNFLQSLTSGPFFTLCTRVFARCDVTYNWVYNMKGYWGDGVTSPREPVANGKDFEFERVIDDFKKVIFSPSMDEKSVLFINWGIHFAAAVNFTNYQRVIDTFVEIVTSQDSRIRAQVIWKSSTALNRERFPNPHKDVRRFLTFHRVLLYNAYATSAMCRAGIPVIDVYPISDSYPAGTVSLTDPVHYAGGVFRSVEKMLVEMFQ